SNEVILSEADAHRARRNGLAWLGAIESVWAREGEARARELMQLSARRAGATEGVLRVVSLTPGAPNRPALSADEFRVLEAGGVVRRVLADAGGQDVQHAWAAVRTAGQPMAIEILEPLAEERTFVRMSHLAIVGATVGVVAICALLASVLQIRLVGRPLALLRDKARRAGAGDFSTPLALRQHDEMGELAAEINAMCDRIVEANRRAADEAAGRLANLEQVVSRTLDLISPAAERAKVRLECTASGPVFARLDQSQIQQVLANVFMNGIQAMAGGGRLRVAVGARRARPPTPGAPEADYLCVTVEDEGRGIPREDLAHVFEPFFTTKAVGEGTGLGLAVAHGIVAEHGGWIEVASEVGK